ARLRTQCCPRGQNRARESWSTVIAQEIEPVCRSGRERLNPVTRAHQDQSSGAGRPLGPCHRPFPAKARYQCLADRSARQPEKIPIRRTETRAAVTPVCLERGDPKTVRVEGSEDCAAGRTAQLVKQ